MLIIETCNNTKFKSLNTEASFNVLLIMEPFGVFDLAFELFLRLVFVMSTSCVLFLDLNLAFVYMSYVEVFHEGEFGYVTSMLTLTSFPMIYTCILIYVNVIIFIKKNLQYVCKH